MLKEHTLCPCHSKKPYWACCEPFHTNKALPKTALELMRSRYSAYAKGLVDYIISTTHPDTKPKGREEILQFCLSTTFSGLTIIEFIDGEKEAFVTFCASLQDQSGKDLSFQEKSRFLKVGDKWFYYYKSPQSH